MKIYIFKTLYHTLFFVVFVLFLNLRWSCITWE